MRTRRLATTGAALVAAFGLTLTGCGSNGTDAPAGGAAPEASAPADPREELSAAALKLNEQSVRVEIKSSALNGEGVMDPKTKQVDMTMSLGEQGTFRMLTVGDDGYMKFSGVPGLPDNWLHLDVTKLGANGQLNIMPDGDPGGAKQLVNGVVDVEKTGDGAFSGTIDYTKAKPGDKAVEQMGEKAKAVPFTARVDDEGRMTELVVDTSVLHESLGKMTTTYSDFGTKVDVQKPPANETQEAPESLLRSFSGATTT
ncbi:MULTISPECIES: hypothetical protein [Micromonospora]|uniref:Lipoprotein LprG n=1 Tax=Micromonospora yangpuensis TaxID=683228 RepID=A0A1C6V864_9ACTN|nr:hypothetical protein [Micromonospora yangpuensis]GGM28817.1 hypothetical protein GCM10012279_54350 [Micromonospora yangpuensis]SCL62347.1 hypothetical protein GA0070617_4901 [Micromonospora yangpuensis]